MDAGHVANFVGVVASKLIPHSLETRTWANVFRKTLIHDASIHDASKVVVDKRRPILSFLGG